MTRTSDGDPVRISSVANALRILDMLDTDHGLRVVDVSRQLDVANSTAHRLLSALRGAGYLRQEAGSSRYFPGHALLRIARRINNEYDIGQVALPHLQALCDDLNETVNLQILVGGDVLFVASAEDQHRLRVATRSGTRGPANATAGGKLLLAQLDPDDVRERIGDHPVALTTHTHVDVDALLQELAELRQRGYAVNLGETDEGVNAVAVLVRDADDAAVAALSLAAPAARLPAARVPMVLPHLRATSAAISVGCFGRASG